MKTKSTVTSVESTLEKSYQALQVPHVRARLGSYVIDLQDAIERTRIVTVAQDGFVDVPKVSDVIPLIPMSIGQTAYLHASDSGMSAKQIESLTLGMGEEKTTIAVAKLRNHFIDTETHHEIPSFTPLDAAVTTSNFWLPNEETLVRGRPNIAVNIDKNKGAVSPVIFLHELIHVLQSEKKPIELTSKYRRYKIRKELEAYYIAAQIIFGFSEAGKYDEILRDMTEQDVEWALKVEKVRAASEDTADKFAPHNRTIKGLVDGNLSITTELGKVIREMKNN